MGFLGILLRYLQGLGLLVGIKSVSIRIYCMYGSVNNPIFQYPSLDCLFLGRSFNNSLVFSVLGGLPVYVYLSKHYQRSFAIYSISQTDRRAACGYWKDFYCANLPRRYIFTGSSVCL